MSDNKPAQFRDILAMNPCGHDAGREQIRRLENRNLAEFSCDDCKTHFVDVAYKNAGPTDDEFAYGAN